MPPPPSTAYFPLRWESTGDQWWYASPIDWAAANGHYDLVHELLRLDSNHLIKLTSLRRIRRLETVWDDDQEQFHDQVAKNRSEVARKLLHGCEPKKGQRNSLLAAGYGGWLLYTAASAGDLIFVRELLDRDPLLVFGEGEYGVTDMLYAAARSKSDEVFKVVLDFAISPRFSSSTSSGVCNDDEGRVGKIPSAYKSEITNRAMHAMARGGNLRLLKELLQDCSEDVMAYRDNRGSTILHAAAARGQVEVVKYLTSSSFSDILANSTDNLGNTALHVAALRGHLRAVETLILASPSLIHAKNDAGATFLHSVIRGFQTPGFQRLDRQIELMTNLFSNDIFYVEEIINIQDNQGQTALHLAIIGNIHSDLVELLMAVDAIDVNIRDVNGMTPLDILRKQPVSDSSEFLTRQLLSAGGILSRQDYVVRKAIASHIKGQSIGNSPGTSFRINDTEIFLYTGLENLSEASQSVGISTYHSPVRSQHDSNMENDLTHIPRKECSNKHSSITTSAAQRLKSLIRWPKMMRNRKSTDRLDKLAEEKASFSSEQVPIPLRQRFSKATSDLSPNNNNNNKRTLSVRSSNVPSSPLAKKKLASGLTVPHRSSRSSSFSKISVSSSQSSVDMLPIKDHVIDHEVSKQSSSYHNSNNNDNANDGGAQTSFYKHKRRVNQYLCFGDPRQDVVEPSTTMCGLKPYDVYERSVLSAA